MCVCVCVCVCVCTCMYEKEADSSPFCCVLLFFAPFALLRLSLTKVVFIKPYRKYPRPENVTHFPIASKKLSFYDTK